MRAAHVSVMVAALSLLLSISGAMGARNLLQCNGGCASWIGGWGAGRRCAACCTGYVMQNGVCVVSTSYVTTAPVVVPGTRPVYTGPYRGGVATSTTTTGVRVRNPVGPRPTTVTAATRTTDAVHFRSLKEVVAGRHLLGSCSSGCASWANNNRGRRTCASCCSGYKMQNGACVAQSTAVKKNPAGGVTATRTQAAAVRMTGH